MLDVAIIGAGAIGRAVALACGVRPCVPQFRVPCRVSAVCDVNPDAAERLRAEPQPATLSANRPAGYHGGYGADSTSGVRGGHNPQPPGGFNWLACFGIGCGVSLLIALVVGTALWKQASPFYAEAKKIEQLRRDINSADNSQVRALAVHVSAADFSGQKDALQGKWVAVEGKIEEVNPQNDDGRQSTTYSLGSGVLVVDISGAAPAAVGDQVRAFGKFHTFDVSNTFTDPKLKQHEDRSPAFKARLERLDQTVYFWTKDVEKL